MRCSFSCETELLEVRRLADAAVLFELAQTSFFRSRTILVLLVMAAAPAVRAAQFKVAEACFDQNYPKPPRCSTRSQHQVRAFLADHDAGGIGVARDHGPDNRGAAAWTGRRPQRRRTPITAACMDKIPIIGWTGVSSRPPGALASTSRRATQPRSAMSNDGAALGAAVPVSNARAATSRSSGARSRAGRPWAKALGAECPQARHAPLQYVVLPEEDAVEYQTLEAALLDELRRKARCSSCWRAGSRSPPGVWRAPIAWRSSCSRSGAGRTPGSAWP